MTKAIILLLNIFAGSCLAVEPGPGYKLVEQTKPDAQLEFFGGPHIDTVINVYSRPDAKAFFRKSFKIVLSSLADPSKKELLFTYYRIANADLSPDGKWIIINDRPGRGECEPRLFKQQTGLKFTEVKEAKIQQKVIDFFIRSNKFTKSTRKYIEQSDTFVEATLWSDDSNSLLLRFTKGQTGEPIWINNWRCIYDLKTGNISTDLKVLNRGAIQSGRYLAPSH